MAFPGQLLLSGAHTIPWDDLDEPGQKYACRVSVHSLSPNAAVLPCVGSPGRGLLVQPQQW